MNDCPRCNPGPFQLGISKIDRPFLCARHREMDDAHLRLVTAARKTVEAAFAEAQARQWTTYRPRHAK